VNKFTWLMICFIAVMVPAVFLINGLMMAVARRVHSLSRRSQQEK